MMEEATDVRTAKWSVGVRVVPYASIGNIGNSCSIYSICSKQHLQHQQHRQNRQHRQRQQHRYRLQHRQKLRAVIVLARATRVC